MYVVDVRSDVARINANVRMTELNPVFDFRLSMFRWFTSEDLTHNEFHVWRNETSWNFKREYSLSIDNRLVKTQPNCRSRISISTYVLLASRLITWLVSLSRSHLGALSQLLILKLIRLESIYSRATLPDYLTLYFFPYGVFGVAESWL